MVWTNFDRYLKLILQQASKFSPVIIIIAIPSKVLKVFLKYPKHWTDKQKYLDWGCFLVFGHFVQIFESFLKYGTNIGRMKRAVKTIQEYPHKKQNDIRNFKMGDAL